MCSFDFVDKVLFLIIIINCIFVICSTGVVHFFYNISESEFKWFVIFLCVNEYMKLCRIHANLILQTANLISESQSHSLVRSFDFVFTLSRQMLVRTALAEWTQINISSIKFYHGFWYHTFLFLTLFYLINFLFIVLVNIKLPNNFFFLAEFLVYLLLVLMTGIKMKK